MIRLDEWLVDRCEQFSHWTQRWFGLTSGFWVRMCLVLSITSMGMVEIPMSRWPVKVVYFVVIFFQISHFIASYLLPKSPRGTMNPYRITYRTQRIFGLIWSVADSIVNIITFLKWSWWFELAVLADYFSACNDLPWSKSRVKELVEALSAVLKPQVACSYLRKGDKE